MKNTKGYRIAMNFRQLQISTKIFSIFLLCSRRRDVTRRDAT